jgi:hypothetical protein
MSDLLGYLGLGLLAFMVARLLAGGSGANTYIPPVPRDPNYDPEVGF